MKLKLTATKEELIQLVENQEMKDGLQQLTNISLALLLETLQDSLLAEFKRFAPEYIQMTNLNI